MRKVVIHQPNFMPYLGFFEQIQRSDVYIAYDDVQFTEHEYQNRNFIKSEKGRDNLTLSVKKKGRLGQLINQVEIADADAKKKIISKLEENYRKAPYLRAVIEPIKEVFLESNHLMADVNYSLIRMICNKLRIEPECHISSQINVSYEDRLDRIFQLMKVVDATTLVAGVGAATYMDPEKFKSRGLNLVIHEFKPAVYPQLYGEFIPYLSIVDYLMNVGWKYWR